MKFINCSYEEFKKNIEDKKVIQFGVSSAWHYYLKVFPSLSEDVLDKTIFIVDNDEQKQDKQSEIAERVFQVHRPNEIAEYNNYVILITVSLAYQENICKQLNSLKLSDDVECYSLPLMTYTDHQIDNSCVREYFSDRTTPKIPAKIHSFWFSGEEKPDLYKRCVDSWYKHCPGFEIIEWNADSYDVTKNQYMFEAFQCKKWAFVSDFARLDILHQYGGIYMDMDVELLASLKTLLCADSFFCRQEDGFLELGSGFGVQAGDTLIRKMLDTYSGRKLILPNGNMDKTPQPEWLNNVLSENGFYKCHDSQIIGNRLILSNDYISCEAGGNTIETARLGVHWHNGGWLDEKERNLIKTAQRMREQITKNYFKKR